MGIATLTLIEQVRTTLPKRSNYMLAKTLRMQQAQLGKVLRGELGIGPKAVVAISDALKRDLYDVMVVVELDKAKTADAKEFWSKKAFDRAKLEFGVATGFADNTELTCAEQWGLLRISPSSL